MLALGGESLNRVGDCRRAGGYGEAGAAALERRDAGLEHALRGVGQSAVDVAGVGEAEAVSRVLAVAENIGCRGIDGHGAGVACGVGLFLTDMEL